MERRLSDNFTSRDTWLRVLYMLLFVMLWALVEVVITAVVLFQVGDRLITGGHNDRLTVFGQQLATYLYQIVLFLTFTSEEKPFPFAPWPDGPPTLKRLPPPEDEYGEITGCTEQDGG